MWRTFFLVGALISGCSSASGGNATPPDASCVAGPGQCPNICTPGTTEANGACESDADCACGLECTEQTCTPYSGTREGCSCMNESACVPGGVIACPCAEGPSGTQECAADGTRYAPCVCAGASDTTEPPPNDANGDCITHFKKACTEDSVYWYDSCGNKEDLVETCPEEFSCAQGACNDPCVPQSVQKCVEDAVYWFDSCDNKQTVALQCTDEQFCQQNSCVEASFSGTWEVTANPDEQALPGFWTASYAPRKLVITVDGDTVTAAVLNENTVYTGTREGKTATLEASYVESGSAGAPATTHASKLTLTLASPGLFLGMDIDTMSADMGQGPTTLGKMIWNITGLFQ